MSPSPTSSPQPDEGNAINVSPYPYLADGSAIPNGEITGYDLFSIDAETGEASFYANNSGAENTSFENLPSGKYAARTLWEGGRSALSVPVLVGDADWKTQLAPPDDSNTFDATEVTELNSCLATAGLRKVCYMSSAAGDFKTNSNNAFIRIQASGTGPDDRVTLMPVPGESVNIVGNWSGNDPDPNVGSFSSQRLLQINADWTRVYGLDISYSSRYGIELNGSYAHIEENTLHHTWHSAIILADASSPSGNVSGSEILYNDVNYVANGTGIWLSYDGSSDSHETDDNVIKGNIVWRNGFLSNDSEAPTNPGDADGIGFFKDCNDAYIPGRNLDSEITGRHNQCHDNKLIRNVAIWNADDCVDVSSGDGTKIIGNLAGNCGDEGNRGFKVFPNIKEKMVWINNLALHQNPNYDGYGSSWGFEIRTNLNTDDGPLGTQDVVGNVAIHNNTSASNVNFRLRSGDFDSEELNGDLYNNVSGFGGSTTIDTPDSFNTSNNHWADESDVAEPDIIDPNYTDIGLDFSGSTVREMWYNKYYEILSRVMTEKDGNLYNNGAALPEFYQTNPADHETTPSNSDSNEQSIWFAGDKTNPVPDKGLAYRYMFAPFIEVTTSQSDDDDDEEDDSDEEESTGPEPGEGQTVYYLDKNDPLADNDNNGSENSPWLTIDYALSQLSAGDFLYIKGGDSADDSEAIYDRANASGLEIESEGTAGNVITIRNYPGDIVVFEGNGNGNGIDLDDASYHHIYGFTFTNFSKATEGLSAGKSNITIEASEFTDTTTTGLRLRNIDGLTLKDLYVYNCAEAGISIRDSDNVLIENVESSSHNGNEADGFHTIATGTVRIIDSVARNNDEDGFDLNSNTTLVNSVAEFNNEVNLKSWRRSNDGYAQKTITIVNSLFRNASESGIKVNEGSRLRLYNSVVVNNGEEGVAFRTPSDDERYGTTSEIINTIIAGNAWDGVELRSGASVTTNNNLYYDNGFSNTDGYSAAASSIIDQDPAFVNEASGDFHISSGSPAEDAGTVIVHDDFDTDIDGESRPQGDATDIGMDEI